MMTFSNWLIRNPVPGFFLLTFILAWSIWLPLGILAPENILLTLPGIWAPTISAFILIGLSDRRIGIKEFLKKILRWRVRLGWYLVVLFSVMAIAYVSIGIGILLGIPAPEIALPAGVPRDGLLLALPIIFLLNIFIGGPLAEDIGWRGYILPKLRERTSALNSSLIIGIVWAIWHLPFFIFPWRDFVGGIPFFWFALLTTGWSVLFAWVYVNTESILMPVFFHAAINTTLGTLGVLGHGAENLISLLLNIVLTWLVVGVVVVVYGKNLKQTDTLSGENTAIVLDRAELR